MTRHVHAMVIGGGPAGALSAAFLAQHGWDVVLIERGPRFRHKACGHCLNARGVALLRYLACADAVERASENQIRNIVVSLAGSDSAAWRIRSGLSTLEGLVIRRSDFDQALRDFARDCGASVLHSTTASILRIDESGAQLLLKDESHEQLATCDLLIGADGVGSAVARRAGLSRRASTDRSYGFAFDFNARDPATLQHAAISMFVTPDGYLGMAPQSSGRVHIGAMVHGSARCNPREFLMQVAESHETLSGMALDQIDPTHEPTFAAAGPMPWRTTRPARDRVLLVGDAAGYIEPFTGEGMTWAIQSAATLNDLLASTAPGRWSASLSARYCALWRQHIKRRQRFCQLVAAALRRPRLSHWLLRSGAKLPSIAERIIARTVAA